MVQIVRHAARTQQVIILKTKFLDESRAKAALSACGVRIVELSTHGTSNEH